MAEQWYVARGKEKSGPYSAAQLKALATQGRLTPTDMVHKEGTPKWVPAGEIKGLFVARAASIQPQPTSASPSPPAAPVAKHASALPALPPSDVIPMSEAPSSDFLEPVIHPNSRAGQMAARYRRRRIIRKVVIASGALFILCCGGVALMMVSPSGSKIAGGLFESKAVEVTAREILKEYEANAVAADEKYKGKMVRIEGVVRDVRPRTEFEEASVQVSGSLFRRFHCYFDDNHKGELGVLRQGQIIAVVGILDGAALGMRKCAFVKPNPVSLELSASQLYREVIDNPELADARYKGKLLKITGKVVSRSDFFGTVRLDDGGLDSWVPYRIDREDYRIDEEELKKFSVGQIITLRGIYRVACEVGECKLVN